MKKSNRGRRYGRSIALFIVLIGIGILTYPFFQILKNDIVLDSEIKSFQTSVDSITDEQKAEMEQMAESYNQNLIEGAEGVIDPFANGDFDTPVPVPEVGGDGIFGYISIPKINETMPLYLGASWGNLALGAAQVDGTSLPVGGMGTRSVIAGHRGYYNRFMFMYVDRLEPGDEINLYIGDRKLTYHVENLEEIYPSENDKLAPVPDKDMVTLLTCTPYPTNRMRLLVNAVRFEDTSYAGSISEDIRISTQNIESDRNTEVKRMLIKSVAVIGSIVWIIVFAVFIKFTLREFRS